MTLRLGAASACLPLLALLSCRSPTQIALSISTDVGCANFKGATITVGPTGTLESAAPIASAPAGQCDAQGRLGDLVITPSGSKSSELGLKIVVGVAIPASECSPPAYRGCIVARRSIHFIPHTPLTLPVALTLDCEDNPCDPTSTCVPKLGCVPAICEGDACEPAPPPSPPATPAVKQLAAGNGLACAVMLDGTVRCWGAGSGGGLGNDLAPDVYAPIVVAGLSGVRQVAVSQSFACALMADRSVTCWGANDNGERGYPDNPTLARLSTVPRVADVAEISARPRHVCARHLDGHVTCWGHASRGAQGDGTSDETARAPAVVRGISGAVKLAGTCVVLGSGDVSCWGEGMLEPTRFPGVHDAVDVATPQEDIAPSVYVVRVNGDVVTADRRLGGFGPSITLPRLRAVKQVGVGYGVHELLDDGSIASLNADGSAFVPVAGLGAGSSSALIAGVGYYYGEAFRCVLPGRARSAAVVCWGDDHTGELGTNKPDAIRTPVRLALPKVKALAHAASATFATLADGSLVGFGQSRAFSLARSTTPQPLTLVTSVKEVHAGDNENRAYVTREGGEIVSVSSGSLDPTAVFAGSSTYVDAYPGGGIDLAFTTLGEIAVHANAEANADGMFGNGTSTKVPKGTTSKVPGLAGAMGLATHLDEYGGGYQHACVWFADGSVKCWGANAGGQAGVAPGPSVNTPTLVAFDTKVKVTAMSAGSLHTCAVGDAGEVYCWGDNAHGQLGAGSAVANSGKPLLVSGIRARGITCWEDSCCAWLTDGTARCWGANDVAQLGDGTIIDRPSPAAVATLTNVVSMTQSCALLGDGSVWCWGDDFDGQVGNGMNGTFPPAEVQGLSP